MNEDLEKCINYDELYEMFSGNSSFSLVRTKSAAIIILFVMQWRSIEIKLNIFM